jgi:hypothetical protein
MINFSWLQVTVVTFLLLVSVQSGEIPGLEIEKYGANGLSDYVFNILPKAEGYFPVAFLETGSEGKKYIGFGNLNAPLIKDLSGKLVSQFCGLFNPVTSEWSGFSSPADITGPIYALATSSLTTGLFSPSSETPLFLGGSFTALGNVASANCIASWDGVSWSSLSGGVSCSGLNDAVNGLVFHESFLYVTGRFSTVKNGDISVLNTKNIARWNTHDKSWSSLNPPVYIENWLRGTSANLFGSSILFTGAVVSGNATILGLFDPSSISLSPSPWSQLGDQTWTSGVNSLYSSLDDDFIVAIYSVHSTSATTFYACGNFITGASQPYFSFWNGTHWINPGGLPFQGETYSAVLVNNLLVVSGIAGFMKKGGYDSRNTYLSTLDTSSLQPTWEDGLTSYYDGEDYWIIECNTPNLGSFYSAFLSSCSGSSQLFLGGSITSNYGVDGYGNACPNQDTTPLIRVVNISTIGNQLPLASCPPLPTASPSPSSKVSRSPSASPSLSPSNSPSNSPQLSASSVRTVSSSSLPLTSLFDENSLIKAANSETTPPLSAGVISGIAASGVLFVAVLIFLVCRLQAKKQPSTLVTQRFSGPDQKIDFGKTGLEVDIGPSQLAELASMSVTTQSPRSVQLPQKPRNAFSIRNLPLTDSPEQSNLRLRTVVKSSRSDSETKVSR